MQLSQPRIEFKYFLPGQICFSFLNDLQEFVLLDKHADKKTRGYRVVSIYFENLNLESYYDKLRGDGLRMKLRLRFYPADESGPLNIELKQRVLERIVKRKTSLSGPSISKVLKSDFFSLDFDETDPVISDLIRLRKARRFYPFLRIDYRRKAFAARTDRQVRLTLDSGVLCSRFSGDLEVKPQIPVFPPGAEILEIKSPGYLPFWLSFLIKKYGLERVSISKYALGVQKVALNSSLFLK